MKSQLERVSGKLLKDGFITRNECLSTYPAITRLSAIIYMLEKKGMKFITQDTNKDYVYKLNR